MQGFEMGYLPEPKDGWVIPVVVNVKKERESFETEVRKVLTELDSDVVPEFDVTSVKAEWQGIGTQPETLSPYSGPVILSFHGGGYITGSPEMERTATLHMARLANCRVFAVDYRLAPQHPFPSALIDAVVAYKYLIAPPDGVHAPIDPKRLVIAGDSAGVCLSNSLI
jgi:acetyl esterase/lipase